MKSRKENLRELRKYTNNTASLAECVKALNKADGDFEKAKDFLAQSGYAERKKPIFSFDVPEDAPPVWVYILSKIHSYLKFGPDIYRKGDALGMPDAEWDEETLREIESCFRQFSDGKGYSEVNPVENVSVGGFYAATNTLHFAMAEQTASYSNDEKSFIDCMLFEHLIDKRTIRLFNKVA